MENGNESESESESENDLVKQCYSFDNAYRLNLLRTSAHFLKAAT